jgi:dTDP-glucose pyrophosphorylase
MLNYPRIESVFVRPHAPIAVAVECIERSGGEIAIVVDTDRHLVGTVTDGDVRRGLLRGHTMQDDVSLIMNDVPRSGRVGQSWGELQLFMEKEGILQLPLLDANGRVSDLVLFRASIEARQFPNLVVLMAGGIGSRLQPITAKIPKPMIHVGGKPLLQTIIEQFVQSGFYRFAISVNHLRDQIVDYFGDGSAYRAEISYLNEAKRLGTAGALSLLPERPIESFFVMNCDILTSVNLGAMLRFHDETGVAATMGVNHLHYEVPYGVVEVDSDRIVSIREKPVYDFFVNSGVYVMSSTVLDLMPSNEFLDMPSLFDKLIKERHAVGAFPIHETWLDIGQPSDLQRAQDEYKNVVA